MKFEIELQHRNVPDEELIEDLQKVAQRTGRNTVTRAEYARLGKYHPNTLIRRFGSWFKVLEMAGLEDSRSRFNINDEELFDNIKDVWISLGRQPKREEIKSSLSKYSPSPYERRFGSWTKALKAFIEYINDESAEMAQQEDEHDSESAHQDSERVPKRRSNRNISERLRFSILLRDGFRCQSCGSSPLKSAGVELHVDHIIPWSKGGETVPENLQTKCQRCNLGKGNAFDK